MTKIIAISFATFLMVFQGISYYGLKEQENSYRNIRNKDTSLAIHSNFREDYLSFLVLLKTDSFKTQTVYTRSKNFSKEPLLIQYMKNSCIHESLQNKQLSEIENSENYTGLDPYQKQYLNTLHDISGLCREN